MIGRIHERRDFDRLSRHGRRARTATLWGRYLDDPAPPRVAFAVGRAVGTAVDRNRLRRRLRAILAVELDHGSLLVGASPGVIERSFDELRTEVKALLDVMSGRQA